MVCPCGHDMFAVIEISSMWARTFLSHCDRELHRDVLNDDHSGYWSRSFIQWLKMTTIPQTSQRQNILRFDDKSIILAHTSCSLVRQMASIFSRALPRQCLLYTPVISRHSHDDLSWLEYSQQLRPADCALRWLYWLQLGGFSSECEHAFENERWVSIWCEYLNIWNQSSQVCVVCNLNKHNEVHLNICKQRRSSQIQISNLIMTQRTTKRPILSS